MNEEGAALREWGSKNASTQNQRRDHKGKCLSTNTHSRLFLFIVSMPVSSREASGAAAGANKVVRVCGIGHTKGR